MNTSNLLTKIKRKENNYLLQLYVKTILYSELR